MPMHSTGMRTVTTGAAKSPARVPANANTAALAVADFLKIVASSPVDLAKRWQEQANCLGVDPDLFFPERGASTREAKGVCRGCEVRLECLEYALDHGEKFGIWGGLSERERRRVRRQRALERRRIASA
jgi:WhiB family redox-sensing transcriptional regulator